MEKFFFYSTSGNGKPIAFRARIQTTQELSRCNGNHQTYLFEHWYPVWKSEQEDRAKLLNLMRKICNKDKIL